METVNFQCGHCGKLMGVSTAFLGQQVRCPHCQGIVVAPAASAAPAPPSDPTDSTIAFDSKPDVEPDSIFSPPEASSDDLFDRPSAPQIEMPPDQTELLLNVPAPAPAPAPQPPFPATTQTFLPGGPPQAPIDTNAPTVALTTSESAPTWMTNGPGGASTTLLQPEPTASLPVEVPSAVVRPARRPSGGAGPLTFIIIFSLISYALLATVYIIVLVNNRPNPYPLLEFMPDVDGDNPGVKKGQARTLTEKKIRELNQTDLPKSLIVGLGKTIRVGDLEVKPLKVELRTVGVLDEHHPRPEPCPHESLVLTLQVRNLATDYRFSPLDNYFDRKYDHFLVDPTKNRAGAEPMTFLVVGKKRFFGGPAEWVPRKRSPQLKIDRQWIDAAGRTNTDEGLAPGAVLQTTICTDGFDPDVANTLDTYEGPLLYRVHVRRGLVAVGDRRVSATAVIGVEFTDRDYRRQ